MENLLRSDSSDVSLPIVFQCVTALLNDSRKSPAPPSDDSKSDSHTHAAADTHAHTDADSDGDSDGDADPGSYSLSTTPMATGGRFRLLCLGLRMLRKSLTLPHAPSGPRRRVLRERIVSCCLAYFQGKPVWIGLEASSSGLDKNYYCRVKSKSQI